MGGRARWLVLVGLMAATPAMAMPTWCELLNRALRGYGHFSARLSEWSKEYGNQFEPPAAADYRERYTAKTDEESPARRYALLKRLGQLPKDAPAGPEPARPGKPRDSQRHHGGGGVYTRSADQFGDTYGRGIDGPGTFPELSRYFNLPQLLPHAPEAEPRFLRDGKAGFPTEGLSAQDYRDLEPLPQSDPLKSYLGVSLVRVFNRDGDKEVPPYEPAIPKGGVYLSNKNYYRRGDGTYYIYDFTPATVAFSDLDGKGFGRPNPVMEQGMRNIASALDTVKDPAEKTKLIQFYVDSIMLFPQAGRERVQKLQAETEQVAKAYQKELATYQSDNQTLLFKLVSALATPRAPSHNEKVGWAAEQLEGYFAFPLFMLAFHKQMGHERTQPELVRALEARVAEYRREISALPAEFPNVHPELKRALEEMKREAEKR